MAKKRNYQSEYARRLARGFAKGLSRSQARGHAKSGEASIKPKRTKIDTAPLEAALKSLHASGSLKQAARDHHISAERFKRYLSENSLAMRVGHTWKITDERPREMTVLSNRRARRLILKNFESASLNGRHLAAVAQFLTSQDAHLLTQFEGQSVTEASGLTHLLETDLNNLYEIANSGKAVFEQIYRLIQ